MFAHPQIRGVCVQNAQPLLYNFLRNAPHQPKVATDRKEDTNKGNTPEDAIDQYDSTTPRSTSATISPTTEKQSTTDLPFYLADLSPTPFVSIETAT